MSFVIDDSNMNPDPRTDGTIVDPANPTNDEQDLIDSYEASQEFINNKDSAIRKTDGSYYNWIHDERYNVHQETVYRREDSAYYMFYQYFGDKTTTETYGWYIHNDDTKTNLPAASFSPSAGNTFFYQHDDDQLFSTTTQLCPVQAGYSWEVEYSGVYYKLDRMNIQMSLSCLDASDTFTLEIEGPASEATDCNNYGIDPSLITQIEDSYETIFNNFNVQLSPLDDTPFWMCVGFHVCSIIFLVIMGVYPILQQPGSRFNRKEEVEEIESDFEA